MTVRFRPACLHCDANPFAERIHGEECIGRDALPCPQLPAQGVEQGSRSGLADKPRCRSGWQLKCLLSATLQRSSPRPTNQRITKSLTLKKVCRYLNRVWSNRLVGPAQGGVLPLSSAVSLGQAYQFSRRAASSSILARRCLQLIECLAGGEFSCFVHNIIPFVKFGHVRLRLSVTINAK
jgi:hypothetical protein